MEKENLIRLTHLLWKQKIMSARALELAERAIVNGVYISTLIETLRDLDSIQKEVEVLKEKIYSLHKQV